MKRKLSTETPVCPQEHLVIISYTTGLSFALERIGPLAAIIITVFYLLVLYLFALPNTFENPFASIYSESLIKTACQHLLLLVGFDTLIYRKYYDTPPILVGHQSPRWGACGWPDRSSDTRMSHPNRLNLTVHSYCLDYKADSSRKRGELGDREPEVGRTTKEGDPRERSRVRCSCRWCRRLLLRWLK
jgi:hypothetical protein